MSSDPSPVRLVLVAFVLMAIPVVPSWVADAFPEAFGQDPQVVDVVTVLISAALFVGVGAFAWWLLLRHVQHDRENQDEQ